MVLRQRIVVLRQNIVVLHQNIVVLRQKITVLRHKLEAPWQILEKSGPKHVCFTDECCAGRAGACTGAS